MHPKFFQDTHDTLGDYTPSLTTVHKWVTEFKHDCDSLEFDPHSKRPKTATTPEIVENVPSLFTQDRRLKVSEISKGTGISDERAFHILTVELGMKRFRQGVLCILTMDQMR